MTGHSKRVASAAARRVLMNARDRATHAPNAQRRGL